MSHIAEFETELMNRLNSGEQKKGEFFRWASEKVLESYAIGYEDGLKARGKGTRLVWSRRAYRGVVERHRKFWERFPEKKFFVKDDDIFQATK
jgi:hypothetical protein